MLDWIHENSRKRISYVRLDYTLYSINYGIFFIFADVHTHALPIV